MQFLLTTFLIFFLCVNSVITITDADWSAYKKKFNKSYPTKLDDWIRRELYAENLEEVELFNDGQANKVGFKMGTNQFCDLTRRELLQLGKTKATAISHRNSPRAERYLDSILNNDMNVPKQLDWRSIPNRVARVKDQGKCKSSWPFVATGLMEGQSATRSGSKTLLELSEQSLVDCLGNKASCASGSIESAFSASHPLAFEPELVANKSSCKFNPNSSALKAPTDYAVLPQDEISLKRVVAKFGPVASMIQLSKRFFRYNSGIFFDAADTSNRNFDCSKVNHGVLIVGYGSDSKFGDYWIVKNSWGTSWGSAGYVKMARNRRNNSGIVCSAIVPIFD